MTAELADLGIAIQSAAGIPAITPKYRIPIAGGNIEAARTIAQGREIRRWRVAGPGDVTDYTAGGSVDLWGRPASLGLALYAALGSKSVSGSSDPWTHTFTGPRYVSGATSVLPWLTVWRNLPGGPLFEQFTDVKVTSLELSGAAGRPIRARLGLAGLSGRYRSGVIGSTFDVAAPLLHSHGKGALLIDGSIVSAIDDWTLTITTGASRADLGSAPTLVDGDASVTFRAGQIVTSPALWNRYHYGSASPADATPSSPRSISNTTSPSGSVVVVGGTAETILPGCDLIMSPAGSITIDVDVWISQSRVGVTKQATIRLRRTSLTGAILRSTVVGDVEDTTGHAQHVRYRYVDPGPTDGHYVLTVQETGGDAFTLVMSDLRVMTLSAGRQVTLAIGGVDLLFTQSSTRSLRLQLPALELVSLDAFEPNAGGGPFRQAATYRAYQPLGSIAAAVTATLRNDVSSY